MKKISLSLFNALAGLFLVLLVMVGAAQAQSLTMNITDTGYDPIPAGGEINYAVRIQNGGNLRADAQEIYFAIPANTIYTGISGGLLSCTAPEVAGPDTVTCQVPSLAPHEAVEAMVLVTPSQEGTITFSGEIPGQLARVQDTTVTTGADLELAFIAPAEVQAGDFLRFQAVITNHGPYAGEWTSFTMLLPAALSRDITMPAGCSIAGNEVTCTVTDAIAPGDSITLDFETQVLTANESDLSVAGSIESSVPADPDLSNDASSFATDIQPGTDVFLRKSRQPSGLVYTGQEVTFTLTPDFAGGVPVDATITDSLPSNYTFTDVAAGAGWSCTPGQTVSCAYSADPADADAFRTPITITAMPITPTTTDRVENIAEIASSTDVVPGNNTASDGGADIAVPQTDLVARKTGPRHGLVTVGNSYDWEIWTLNEGNTGFAGRMHLTEHVPAGLRVTNIATPAGWNCAFSAPVDGPADIQCQTDNYTTAAPLAVGQQTPRLTVTTEVLAEGSLSNGLTVSDQNPNFADGDLSNNRIYSGVTSGQGPDIADLTVLKTVTSSGPYNSGDPVSFAVEIVNAGPRTAQTVRMVDRLEDLYFADSTTTAVTIDSAPGMSCQATRGSGFYTDLACTIDELPVCTPGSCPVVTFTALAGSDGPRTNTAEVYSTVTPDPNYGNNTDSAGYAVDPRTDVTVEKTASHANGAEVQAGQELIYVLTASLPGNGLSAADNVTITDNLPAGLRIVDVVSRGASCGPVSGLVNGITTPGSQLVCNFGTIANGSSRSVDVHVVPTTEIADTSITNPVTIATSTPEIDLDNNADDITHVITRPSLDLVTNKVDRDDPLELGESTVYTVTVQNIGPSEAFNVVITDILPTAGMRYDGFVPASGMVCRHEDGAAPGGFGGRLVCDVAHLPVGAVAALQVNMTAMARGQWTNRVEVRSDEYGDEPNTGNNDVNETTDVFERVDLTIAKAASQPAVDLGESFNWTIEVENLSDLGLGLAENVVVRDSLPANMVIADTVTADHPGVSCDGPLGSRNVICILPDMTGGETHRITVPVRVTEVAANPQQFANTATVETDSFDRDTSNNSAQGTVDVHSTSVSGSIWRDFNKSDTRDANDSGFGGLTVTLTGTDDWGVAVNRSMQTAAGGSYDFDLLPPGQYSVSYAPPSGRFETGNALPGTGGGGAASETAITAITATTDAPAPDNDFTLIPQAQIALAKQLGTPVAQADGSWRLDYTFCIRNDSEEPVGTLTLTDDLRTDFGSLVSGAPDHGQFQIVANSANVTVASSSDSGLELNMAGPINAGQTATVNLSLLVNPALPRVANQMVLTNDATVGGIGEWSGQTPSDASNNGATPTYGATSPTTQTIAFDPRITLEKTASLTMAGTTPAPGDRVIYTFTVTNTGNTPLQGVEITDPLPGLVWDNQGPIALLNPGDDDSTSYVAHYILTQDDVENGGVDNIATASGQWAESGVPGHIVSDDDEAAITALAEPGLEIEKEFVSHTFNDSDPALLTHWVTYRFIVTNTGNVEIRDLVVSDAMLGLTGAQAIDIGTLAPGASVDIPHTDPSDRYYLTQADIDAGRVVNTAHAAGTHAPGDTPIETPSNEVSLPLVADPQMRVTKLLDSAPTEPRAGDAVTWTVTIENTGNTTLENIVITEPLTGATASPASPAVVPPGEEATATVTYTLTQADIDAGELLNQVTVSGSVPGSNLPFDPTPSGNDPVTPNEDETRTPLPAAPSVALLKELTSDVSDALMPGDEITFDFTIRNTGNVTLENIALTDDLPAVVLDLTPLAGLQLAPGADVVVTGTYELTAADIAAGGLVNTATTTAEDPHDTEVEDDSGTGFDNDTPTPVTLLREPQIALIKTVSSAPTAPVQAGDVVEYTFEIHNTGNVELRNITLTELVAGVEVAGSRSTPLPAGGVDDSSFTARHVLTQADIDAGEFANTARVDATGTDSSGTDTPVSDISGTDLTNDQPTALPIPASPALIIVKLADDTAVQNPARLGDVITYSFTVENTGNITLTDVTVTDPLPGLFFPDGNSIASLAPGQDHVLSATYALVQGDIDAGEVVNRASVSGDYTDPVLGSITTPPVDSDEVTVPLVQAPAIDLVKRITSTLSAMPQEGEIVTYGFTVTNTGNIELTDVTVAELLNGATVTGGPITLAPNQSDDSSFTASYVLTQADIEAGLLDNQAQATGNDAINGTPVSDLSGNSTGMDEETRLTIPQLPGIELTKTGSISDFADPAQPVEGDEIRYTLVVENTGNVTLREISLSDPGMVFDAGAPAPFTLEPGESRSFADIGGHTLLLGDLDIGSYENTASVTGQWGDPGNPGQVDDDDTVTTPLAPVPDIALVKLIDSTNSHLSTPPQAGDEVHYDFIVTNTGNVTLTDITITDPLSGLVLTGSLDRLEPGLSDASAFSATYVLTQDDINRGDLVNQATVEGRTGTIPEIVTDISGTDIDNDDETLLDLPRNNGLSVVKSADNSGLQTPTQPGDIVGYRFVITNTGNVTLTDVTLTDPLPVELPVTVIDVLEPGADNAVTLTGSYVITQEDIARGLVENTADVVGTFTDPVTGDRQTPSSPSNRVEQPLTQQPQLAVVKSAQSALTDPAEPGQQITYEFRVINTGNVRLENVVLTDPLPGISPDEFDLGDMEPGAELTATATYAITQADIDAGRVVNQATVTGTFDGTPISDLSGPNPETDEETVVPVPQGPGLTLVKSADAAALSDPAVVGQEILYSFTVTNTGNVVLRDLVIADPLQGLEPGRFELAELVPGQDVTVGPARYAITQADINAGAVENRALASGEYGPPDDPGRIETPSTNDEGVDGPTVTPIAVRPAIALVKALDPAIDPAGLGLGDQIRWVFTVTNTGNVPLDDVRVIEEMVDATVTGGPIRLDAGETDSDSFTASYVITQADLDAGRIMNSARATGSFDDGSGTPRVVEDVSGETIDDDEPVITDLGQRAEIDLVKQADLSGLSSPPQAGEEVAFSFVITNTGEITLTEVTLTDSMEGLELTGAPIGRLAPGAGDRTSYRAVYRLTQADIDAGASLENQAVVTGDYSDPSGDPQQVTDLSGTETGTDGPTLVPLERITGLELEKTADTSEVGEVAQEGDRIVYGFAITNTGNVTLNDVTVDDPLPGLELSGAPIASLAPGETSTAITGSYALTAEDIVAAMRDNTATANGEWRPDDGQPAMPVASEPSTASVPLGYPEVDLEITIGALRDLNGDGVMGPGDQVLFLFEVVNTGTVPLCDVNLDLASLSLSMPGLSCRPISLEVGARAFLECTGAAYAITQADAGGGEIRLSGDAIGTSDAGVTVRASSQAATVDNLGRGGLSLEKLAGVETAMIGDLVPYTIRITNEADGVEVSARLEDVLPPGFAFSAGSARLDGTAVELQESGRRIRLEPVTVQPGQTRVLTLQARVGSSVQPGAHVNRVRLLSRMSGADIAPEATATVRVLADAVMQCATVLGRVFDDADQNGHMSQSAEERGLPNVRLIAPNGLAINTDEHGRFNVPCAALPQAVGSNFMLKLDERTLPAGYRLTTENPRVVRLTPGMITRLDFGATMARLVRIDLAANAFDGADMGAPLRAGLRQLTGEIRDSVAMLRIAYLLAPGEGEDSARRRLRMVERHLRDLWRGEGRYKLNIETLIQRVGEAQ